MTHLAAILKYSICKAAVALCSDLHIIGALQQNGLLQVACGLVHVSNAVLAVVGDGLSGLSRQQSQEVQLDAGSTRSLAAISVAELLEKDKILFNIFKIWSLILLQRKPS